MKNYLLHLLFVVSCILFTTRTEAQSSARVSVQGTLKNSTGVAVDDGSYTATFRLYTVTSGGTALWTETADIQVVGGVYSHLLGSVTALNPSNFGNRLYLGVTVGGNELTPRTELTYAPYALSVGSIAGNGQSASFDNTGKLIVSDKLRVTGTLEIPGGISGNLGAVSCSSVSSTGSISGSSLNVGSGSITAGTITGTTLSGTHSGSWSGAFSASGITSTGNITTSTGNISGARLSATSTVSVANAGTPSGVDLAIGDSDTGIEQSAEGVLNIKTNGGTKIHIGNVNVGVGITTPQALLHVEGTTRSVNAANSNYFHYIFADGEGTKDRPSSLPFSTVVAIFKGDVLVDGDLASATGFTFSDARTKNILGRSNSRNDLSILNSLRITDYQMVDRFKDGNNYKKVIAQEVEEVFPQAVKTSRHIIPNVYDRAAGFRYSGGMLTITTNRAHNFTAGDEIDLITSEERLPRIRVISVEDAHTFTVAAEKAPENVFVYGKYVDDFKSVDYEALSMLNISATQEMYRQIQQLQQENEALRAGSASVESRLAKLEAMLNIGTSGTGASGKR
jgi:hypothetical protein